MAGDGEPATLPRGLGDEHDGVAARLRLDARARGRAARLLVGNEHDGNRHVRPPSGRVKMGERRHGDRIAALHVVDAGAVGPVAVDPPGQVGVERSNRMDRVDVAEQQDAWPFRFARDAADQDVAIAHRAGDALNAGAGAAQKRLRMIRHAVDRRDVLGRALDGHPLADGIEECFGSQSLHGRPVRSRHVKGRQSAAEGAGRQGRRAMGAMQGAVRPP